MGEFLYPNMDLQKCCIVICILMYAIGTVLILSLFSVVIILLTPQHCIHGNYLYPKTRHYLKMITMCQFEIMT